MDLQARCADSSNADLVKELLTKKAEFHILASKEATESLLKSRQTYYEFGDKPSKILAHQIWQCSSSLHITQINTADGITINPQTINDQFRDLYASLYTSESSSDETQYENFFRSLNIPSIDPETSSGLDEPFTVGEIKCALMSMQNGKCPCPDHFPAEFLKTFADK